MRVFGIAGWSGSGKTTLICRLLPALVARGLSVATVKHAHHRFDFLDDGAPARAWRAAGARDILLASPERWALMHELRGEKEPALRTLLDDLDGVDLALIEGFKRRAHDKLEVYREAAGAPALARDDASVVAIASDCGLPPGVRGDGPARPVLDLDDTAAIAAFILAHCGLSEGPERADGTAE